MARIWILVALLALAVGIVSLAGSLLEAPPGATLPSDVRLDHSRPRPQGGFYRCPVPEPRSLNPFVASSAVARQYVLDYTHDALLDYDPADATLRPALAASIPLLSVAEDGSAECVFELRENLRFDHGGPVTMEDVLFSYHAARGPKLNGDIARAARSVENIEALDARRFRVRFERPHFAAVERFGNGFRIVDSRWFREQLQNASDGAAPKPGSPAFSDALLTITTPGPATGPYRLHGGQAAAWRRGRSLNMSQNPLCWRRAAQPEAWNLAGIQLLFDPALSGSVIAALNQRIDYLTSAAGDLDALLERQPRLAAHYRLATYQKLQAALLLVVWNTQRPPFDKAEVRRAMTMLFDRQEICDVVFDGQGEVASSWFRPGSAELDPGLSPAPFDPAAAAALLDESGVDREGFEVPIICPADVLRRPLLLARPAFARAGIRLKIVDATWENTQRMLAEGDFPGGVILFHNHAAIIDPADQFHSETSASFGGYADAEFDTQLETAAQQLEPEARRAAFRALSVALAERSPVSPLLYPAVRVLIHRRFAGAEIGTMGLVPERWWVQSPLR